MATFDLASFYDTISHDLLLKGLFPKITTGDLNQVSKYLQTWSSDRAVSKHSHGLPQGPIASGILAECFLLPIDLELQKRGRGYIRYVDDIRLFGKTEDEVRTELIKTESLCRERGLIPQTGKCTLKKLQGEHEAVGALPSISDPNYWEGMDMSDKTKARQTGHLPRPPKSIQQLRRETKTIETKGSKHYRQWQRFESALEGKPYRVRDKSLFRGSLFCLKPDTGLLRIVLKLLPLHPEHADMLFLYLGKFGYRKPIERLCHQFVYRNPYSFVRGEAWHLLSRYLQEKRSMVASDAKKLAGKALEIAKRKNSESLAERWGACRFLNVLVGIKDGKYKTPKQAEPLLQAFLAPDLPDAVFTESTERGVIKDYLHQKCPEPGLSVCAALRDHKLPLRALDIQLESLSRPVQHTLHELGVMSEQVKELDQIAEYLNRRYRVRSTKSWHQLLQGKDYLSALARLKEAEEQFSGVLHYWLTQQNLFNEVVFCALQLHLSKIGHKAACKATDKNGNRVKYGVMLDKQSSFSKNYPTIADSFRKVHSRRNDVAHPNNRKNKKTADVRSSERNKLVSNLCRAYADFVELMPE